MKAPAKIWINPPMDLPKLNGVIDKDSVEYIRKDAFIDKACEFISRRVFNCAEGSIIEDFKKYMEE